MSGEENKKVLELFVKSLEVAVPTYNGALNIALIREFIYKMNAFISVSNLTEDLQVKYVESKLRGAAALWAQDLLTSGSKDKPKNWETFELKLKERFIPKEYKHSAMRKLESLKQVNSCLQYSEKFRELLREVEISTDQQVYFFLKGLKDEIRTFVGMDEMNLISLDSVEKASFRYDSLMALDPKNNQSRQYPLAANVQNKFNNWSHQNKNNNKNLDVKCYNCGKRGHIARNCRSPKREGHTYTKKANVNHTLVKQEKDQEIKTKENEECDFEPIRAN
ncbi:hypothetical protein HMI56_004930 [Coelomomyces lativittatus]|nr:hypothetical protein HMI56_004930 [Coelomomyces lativittatus]